MRKTARQFAANPSQVKVERDLFAYGVTAKISGVQGRRQSELRLVVEGLRRFRVERFTQFKPYVECEVTLLGEESQCDFYERDSHSNLYSYRCRRL